MRLKLISCSSSFAMLRAYHEGERTASKRPLVCGSGFSFLRAVEWEGTFLLVNSLIQEEES